MQQTAAMLMEKYDGDIPDTIEGMLELPGIGPKMGYLALQIAFDKTLGIGVDIHVHRISNRYSINHNEIRLGWVKSKNPEGTRHQLEEWLPRENWKE
jgi:endonuclease-3